VAKTGDHVDAGKKELIEARKNRNKARKVVCLYVPNTHTQMLYGFLDFVRDNPGKVVPKETFTHSHLS